MFYEKLVSIYRTSACHKFYPEDLVGRLDNYLQEISYLKRKHVDPFKFSLTNDLPLFETLRFFLFFAREDGIFEIKYYFDCTRMSCNERVFLTKEQLDGQTSEELIICEECGKYYDINDVAPHIKLIFVLKSNFILNPKIDPNSSYDALKRMSQDLKSHSPSSIDNDNRSGEGEHKDINIAIISEANVTPDGEIISSAVQVFIDKASNGLFEV